MYIHWLIDLYLLCWLIKIRINLGEIMHNQQAKLSMEGAVVMVNNVVGWLVVFTEDIRIYYSGKTIQG